VPKRPARSGFPETDPFEPHQPDIDIAREGADHRGDDRRNTGRLPDPKTRSRSADDPDRRDGAPPKP